MSYPSVFSIPLNDPRPVPDPARETLGQITWIERQALQSHESVVALKDRYAKHFGSSQMSTRFDDENDLRNANRKMLLGLVNVQGRFELETEKSLDQLGRNGSNPRQRWLDSPMHRRYVNEVAPAKPNTKNTSSTRDIKQIDLLFWDNVTCGVGILAEYKFLDMPKAYRPNPFNSVWRECFYQAAWYLAGAHYMVGTRLALAVVNSRFQRLHLFDDTLSVEVHANVTSRERGAVTTIQQLEDASAIWGHGAPHDFFDPSTNEFIETEFNLYRDTWAQGVILTANMMDAVDIQPPGSQWDRPSDVTGFTAANVEYDIDGKVEAANLKVNKWADKAHNARRKPKDKPPKQHQHNGPKGGGAGGSKGRPQPYQAPPGRRRTNVSAPAATATSGQTRGQNKAGAGKKKNRVLNVIFPWRWFRRDDRDRGGPPASLVRQVLSTYKIKLVTPHEMNKLIAADVAKATARPSHRDVAISKRNPQQTTIRPLRGPTTQHSYPACSSRPTYPSRLAQSPMSPHTQHAPMPAGWRA